MHRPTKPQERAEKVAWIDDQLGPTMTAAMATLTDSAFDHVFEQWWTLLHPPRLKGGRKGKSAC